MTQVILPAQDQDLPERRAKVRRLRSRSPLMPRITFDKIKEQAGVETYDQAILFLIRERTETPALLFREITRNRSFYPRGG